MQAPAVLNADFNEFTSYNKNSIEPTFAPCFKWNLCEDD